MFTGVGRVSDVRVVLVGGDHLLRIVRADGNRRLGEPSGLGREVDHLRLRRLGNSWHHSFDDQSVHNKRAVAALVHARLPANLELPWSGRLREFIVCR